MRLFDPNDDIGTLDATRSILIGLAVFFILSGLHLTIDGTPHGGWMILAGVAWAFGAFDAHRALRIAENPQTLRARLGYSSPAISEQREELQKSKFARFINSKGGRLTVVLGVAWSAYVICRTAGSYEVLGVYLRQWDADYFLVNWLGVPAVFACLWVAWRWVAKANS